MTSEQRAELQRVYYDPKTGFQSAAKLKRKLPNIPLLVIKQFISDQSTDQQFRTRRVKHFHPLTADGNRPFRRVQIDLMDMQNFGANHNKGYNYVLLAIDVFSRYLIAVPIKTKGVASVKPALTSVLDTIAELGFSPPQRLDSDGENSFKSIINTLRGEVDTIDLRGITTGAEGGATTSRSLDHITNQKDDHRALAFVDRVTRTMRQLINRYCNANRTSNWYAGFKDLVANYNTSEHVSLNDTPEREKERTSLNDYYQRLVANKHNRAVSHNKTAIKIGDRVRCAINFKTFQKRTEENFSQTIHTVTTKTKSGFKISDSPKVWKAYQLLVVANSEDKPEEEEEKQQPAVPRQQVRSERQVQRRINREGLAPDVQNSLERRYQDDIANLPPQRKRKQPAHYGSGLTGAKRVRRSE